MRYPRRGEEVLTGVVGADDLRPDLLCQPLFYLQERPKHGGVPQSRAHLGNEAAEVEPESRLPRAPRRHRLPEEPSADDIRGR